MSTQLRHLKKYQSRCFVTKHI